MPALDSLDVAGTRVLVRSDLNVPLRDGAISDDMRIRAALPTIKKLLSSGAQVVVCSHLGRPKGKVVEDLSLAPVRARLEELLDRPVTLADDVVGDSAREACASDDEVVLLENLRFEPGEEKNDPDFADALSSLGKRYVDDAFGAAHRAHASIVGPPKELPSAAGLLLQDEVDKLSRLLDGAEHPYIGILGGAKVSDKLAVIDNLLERVDALCIGGAMAFTLLAAKGEPVGNSLVERDRPDEVAQMLKHAEARNVAIHLPTDVVAADSTDEGADHAIATLEHIGDRMGVDIGPRSARDFAAAIDGARTVLWNGPMGIFEIDDYAKGTKTVAQAVAGATKNGAYTVVGGGDSAAALRALGMEGDVTHLSTGGGASLEFLEGKDLPGIAALRSAKSSH
ncbi:MAG: phosphoglycerate kinase [Actinomycetota bacterium]